MAGWTGLGAGVKALVLGGAASAAAVVGAVVWQGQTVPKPPRPEPEVPVASAPTVTSTPEATPVARAERPAAAAGPAEAVQPPPGPPSFDVVRVEPDGATLVAGRAGAGQEVAVLVDGAEAALALADPQGRFVVFLTLASSSSARIMTLELRPEGRAVIPSKDQVLLAPTAAPAPEPVAEAPARDPVTEPPAEAAQAAPDPGASPPAAPPSDAVAAAVPPADPVVDAAEDAAPAVAATAARDPLAEAAPTLAAEPEGATAVVAAEPVPETPPEPAPVAAVPSPAPASAPAEPQPPVAPEVTATAASDAGPAPEAGGAAAPTAAEPAAVAAVPVPEAAPEHAQSVADPSVAPLAPTALLLSGNSVRVLQSPGSEAVPGPGTVSIDTISYTATGEVALSGRGGAQAFVRLYLDNRPLLETAVAEDGTWGGTLPAVAPGVYVLRADQVSAAGQVTSRYETPFQREDPAALSAPVAVASDQSAGAPHGPVVAGPGRVSITVQPGFTLWRIARENYGDGALYVRVYDANKTLIRDPDLIYPGQVFSVPTGD